jgi:hypothetical protein
MQVLGGVINGHLGVAARIAALRRSSPTVSPLVPTLIAAEFPILATEAVLAALTTFTLIGPLGLPWCLPIIAVPRNERPNPIALRGRSLLLVLVLGAAVILTTALSGLPTAARTLGAPFAAWLAIAAIPLASVLDVALFMVAFRALTASRVPWRQLRVGGVTAGLGWQLVLMLGTSLVTLLKGAPET